MSKLTYEDKINLYNDRKSRLSIQSLVSKYNIYYYNYDRIKVKLKGLSPVNYRLQSSN